LGDASNNFDSAVGAGVLRDSPVEVRTTPFMADGIKSIKEGRDIGVSSAAIRIGVGFGRGVEWTSNFRRRCVCAGVTSTTRGVGCKVFLTSSKGLLSFRPRYIQMCHRS